MSNTINNLNGIATLTAVSMNDSTLAATTHLPTAEEYKEAGRLFASQLTRQWSEPKYQCPKCGGGMCKNLMVVLTTYPSQYEYQCDKCGYIDYQDM